MAKHSSNKLEQAEFFFSPLKVSEGCYSGCKSWEKAKKPIAAVKTNCVCYCGHCTGKVNVFTHIMENMIVSQHQENYVKNFSAQLFIQYFCVGVCDSFSLVRLHFVFCMPTIMILAVISVKSIQ